MVMKIIAEVGVNHNGSLLKAKKYMKTVLMMSVALISINGFSAIILSHGF